ncbi:MAG: 50S ribosomal protein L30 [Coriobacteriales bacterium]
MGYKANQGETFKALGLGKIGSTVEQVDNDAIRGMIFKVKHLMRMKNI